MNFLTTRIYRTSGALVAERSAWKLLNLCVAFAAMLLVLAPIAAGQDNATISGTVADSTGAVLPNAAISLINPATSQTRESTSNNDGFYRFANVGIGTYTLTGTAAGFQKYTKTDI